MTGQQTTKLLIATVSPLLYLVLKTRLNNIPKNSSEQQCLAHNQQQRPWPWVLNAVKRYTGQCYIDCYITSPTSRDLYVL